MRYLPYAAASSEPNVIVDGMANDRTLITLSHWRRSGTPADLMADTSTAIVFNYLDRPDLHVPADVVSNNHFDEDGLVGIYALLEPEAAASRRDLLIALPAATRFAAIAPGVVHALHMPSHFFIQLGMWDDVSSSNDASYVAALEMFERQDTYESDTQRYFNARNLTHALD